MHLRNLNVLSLVRIVIFEGFMNYVSSRFLCKERGGTLTTALVWRPTPTSEYGGIIGRAMTLRLMPQSARRL